MMVYKHLRTGVLYRYLLGAFDVSRQCRMVVYCSLESGAIFTREEAKFFVNFAPVNDPQAELQPKEPHP